MGCAPSRIDVQEGTVAARCCERRKLIRDAAGSRRALAAAHAAHAAALRNVGDALAGYASMSSGKVAVASATPAAPSLSLILGRLNDHFTKASESGEEVSMMLQAFEARGFVDYSAEVMRAITWSNPGKVQDKDDDCPETLATVLDKLSAWENKLFEEAKGIRLMKLVYQQKLMLLNNRKKRGVNPDLLERTRAVVSHLRAKLVVDVQSMESTIREINLLRHQQLYPKLVELILELEKMWQVMHERHHSQLNIMLEFRNFDTNATPNDTSDKLFKKTVNLWNIVKDWHAQLDNLQKYQNKCVNCLYSWLELTLVPTDPNAEDKQPTAPTDTNPPIKKLLSAWSEGLQKLPPADDAISRFSDAIQTIKIQLEEEQRLEKQCADTGKELEKCMSAQCYNTIPEVTERKSALEVKLKAETESYWRRRKSVRERLLVSFRTLLPELFRAVSEFALASCEMCRDLLEAADSSCSAFSGEFHQATTDI